MSYYDDEIKKELEEGLEYTEREIASLLYFKEGSTVLSPDTSNFSSNGTKMYVVANKFEVFLHQCKDLTYQMPNQKKFIYVVNAV